MKFILRVKFYCIWRNKKKKRKKENIRDREHWRGQKRKTLIRRKNKNRKSFGTIVWKREINGRGEVLIKASWPRTNYQADFIVRYAMYWFGSGQKPRSCAVNAKLSSTLGKPVRLRRGDAKRPKLLIKRIVCELYKYFWYIFSEIHSSVNTTKNCSKYVVIKILERRDIISRD